MKADVLLKYHQILAKRGPADAALYFALQFEGSDWREDEVLPKNVDYITRSRHEEKQKLRQREGMLLANQYFSQALASNDPIVKVRALSGRWRTMFWLAKEFFDRWGTNTNNDDRRRITTEIKTSIEWRIALRAAGFPQDEYWPCRLFEKGMESSILEAERWHFEKILMTGNRRYRDRLGRFSDIGGVLWALGVIAELGLDGKPAPERAIELYEKALSARCSWASWRLGDMLAASGKTQDARAAYEAGAALGHPLSKFKLALSWDEEAPGLTSVELLVDAARAGVGDAWLMLRNFLAAQDVEGGISGTEIETLEKVAVDLCSPGAIRDAIKREKPGQDRYQRGREIDRMWSVLSKSQNAQGCYDAALHYLDVGYDGDNALYLMFLRAARLGSANAQYHLGRFHDPCVSKSDYSYSRDAEESYKQKNPLVAFMWYEKAAENGNVEARYKLAEYYKEGKIVSQDAKKCFELTLLAAESMHRQALLDIASYAKIGYGCEKNVQLAIDCYKKILSLPIAAEEDKETRGIAQVAARELARIYDDNFGDGARIAEAFEYYSIAANIYDDPEAHKKLSEWYETGTGVVQDINKAAEHLTKYLCIKYDSFEHRISKRVNHHKVYADHKYHEVNDLSVEAARCIEIAYAYETGVQACSFYPPRSERVLASDEIQSFKWYWRAYEMGAKAAGLRCAEMLISGIGCDQDVMRARVIYIGLADDNFLEACLALAKMYSAGLLAESDETNCSMYWLQRASALGDERSRYLIGLGYENPKGAGRDMTKAIAWYKLSHCEEAYLRLAHCYRDGDGVAEDRNVAAQYFRMCSSITARIEFANMCMEHGERLWGTPQRRVEAFHWFLRAARLKSPKGQLRVAELYLHGDVVNVSLANAARWNYWAAECHEAEGQWRFGAMCELGLGVEQSLDLAKSYYRAASDQGHGLAKLRLIELGCLPWQDIEALADSEEPEACYVRGMSTVRPGVDENAHSRDLLSAVHDLEIAAKGGISEALYGLFLCKMIDPAMVQQSSDELLVEGINKGSRLAMLCWAKKRIDEGSPNEAIPKLWELYADGYKDAVGLLHDAYDNVCRKTQPDDAHVAILRRNDVNKYLKARLMALETVHDKGKLSILLQPFVSSKNDSVINVIHKTFNVKFNSYRKEPVLPYYPEPADFDDRDDYMPRTFEDAYEIYGSRLWDA